MITWLHECAARELEIFCLMTLQSLVDEEEPVHGLFWQ